MKKGYTGLKAEKIDFGSYDSVTTISVPSTCIQIVADQLQGTNTCQNPEDTTMLMWVGDNPYGD